MFLLRPRRIGPLLTSLFALIMLGVPLVEAEEINSADVINFVEEAFAADRVPGGAVVIIINGDVGLVRGFGHDAKGRPVTPHTGFRLGSMSKAFTALAALRLIDREVISLDTPVRALLTEFHLADMEAANAITLRHLLNHTSGIPERAPRAGTRATLAQHIAALGSVSPDAQPGEEHIYASPNYLVAARLLEVATGAPFETIVRQEVFDALGMDHSFASAAEDEKDLLSGGHLYWFGVPLPSNLSEEPGRIATASLISSAEDLARFLEFQLGDGLFAGNRVLSEALMTTMHQGAADGDGFRYAMGWRDTAIMGARVVEHGGILPDYRGKMVLIPEMNAGLVVLTNASTLAPLPALPTSHRVADSLAEYLLGKELRQPTVTFGVASLAVAAGLALILVAALRGLVRVVSGQDTRAMQPLRALIDIAIVAAIALILPAALGLDWFSLLTLMPDFTIWVGVVALVTMLTSIARLVRNVRPASD